MRVPGRVALFGLALFISFALVAPAADDPAPLLKPAAPTGGALRVRTAVTPGHPKAMQMSAQVPRGNKKSELIDIVVAVDSMPNPSFITAKKLESWGYEAKGREFVLPELILPMSQIAPKPTKGSDANVRLTNIKLTVLESPASGDSTVFMSDICLSATAFYQGNERSMEPRLSFGDKFLEMTVPAAMVKRPGTDVVAAPPVTGNADAALVPSVALTTLRGGASVLASAAVNGQETYKLANGTVVPVNVVVASLSNWDTGIVVTIGLARGCKVDMEAGVAGKAATGAEIKSEMIPGKMKELRLGLFTGPGLKVQKDFVLKDVPVMVDKNVSEGLVYLGPKFMETYFHDGVYAGGDSWKLHGRISPDLLFEKKKKP